MKLWMVEEFRCDYTCGMGFALAEDYEQAVELIRATCDWHDWTSEELANLKPYDLDQPRAWSVAGGG